MAPYEKHQRPAKSPRAHRHRERQRQRSDRNGLLDRIPDWLRQHVLQQEPRTGTSEDDGHYSGTTTDDEGGITSDETTSDDDFEPDEQDVRQAYADARRPFPSSSPSTLGAQLLSKAAASVARHRLRKAPLPRSLMTANEAKAAAAAAQRKQGAKRARNAAAAALSDDDDDEDSLPEGIDLQTLRTRATVHGASAAELAELDRAIEGLAKLKAKKEKRAIKRANRAQRVPDGTLGQKEWLQEPFECHLCTPVWTAKSTCPHAQLRRHYKDLHNYQWRKNTSRQWSWIPDNSPLPEDEFELFAYYCRTGSRKEKLRAVSWAAWLEHFHLELSRRNETWQVPVDPYYRDVARKEHMRSARRAFKLAKLLPRYLDLDVPTRRQLHDKYMLEGSHPAARQAVNEARRQQEEARTEGWTQAELGPKIRARKHKFKEAASQPVVLAPKASSSTGAPREPKHSASSKAGSFSSSFPGPPPQWTPGDGRRYTYSVRETTFTCE